MYFVQLVKNIQISRHEHKKIFKENPANLPDPPSGEDYTNTQHRVLILL